MDCVSWPWKKRSKGQQNKYRYVHTLFRCGCENYEVLLKCFADGKFPEGQWEKSERPSSLLYTIFRLILNRILANFVKFKLQLQMPHHKATLILSPSPCLNKKCRIAKLKCLILNRLSLLLLRVYYVYIPKFPRCIFIILFWFPSFYFSLNHCTRMCFDHLPN